MELHYKKYWWVAILVLSFLLVWVFYPYDYSIALQPIPAVDATYKEIVSAVENSTPLFIDNKSEYNKNMKD